MSEQEEHSGDVRTSEIFAPSRLPASDATRNHLANERTFLAWIRTALAMLGFGFVLCRLSAHLSLLDAEAATTERFREVRDELAILGVFLLTSSAALGFWSGFHYFQALHAINQSSYEPARRSIALISSLVVGVSIVIGVRFAWRFLTQW